MMWLNTTLIFLSTDIFASALLKCNIYNLFSFLPILIIFKMSILFVSVKSDLIISGSMSGSPLRTALNVLCFESG